MAGYTAHRRQRALLSSTQSPIQGISSVCFQASGSVSSEGGRNGPQAWNPKAEMDTCHAGPHPVLRDPTRRRGSAPESFSSSISSITITSRKVTHTNSRPPSPAMNSLADGHRKALAVKVTEQRMKSTSSQTIASTSGSDREEKDHGVVLRRKATIVKMTEQRERFSPAKYRHSYTEGLHNESKVNPSPSNQPCQHRSSLSLFLNNPNESSAAGESDTKASKPPRRPLSCDASLFNCTQLGSNAVTHPVFHNQSSPVPQKTNIDLVRSSIGEARRRWASGGEVGIVKKEWGREEPVSGINPLTLLKAEDTSADLSADAVLALNAAAVIANIKLQAQQRRTTSHTATAVCLSEDIRQSEHRELKEESAGADGKKKTCPADQCVDFVPFESQNDLSETALAPLSLSEALASRRPDFIQRSQARVRALERRSQERQNSLSSPQTLQSGESLVKSKDRSIMGKSLQLQSRRSYNQLPHVKKRREEEKRKIEEEKRKLASRTNRLRAELFKKKLLEQILQRRGNH
ncbi:uncharacterized protein LOC113089295 [Carassius auratus]|uniref:Uncharacterized protein LOC113089295 n=1 Tax=Carassius auratus TaxID=7957 RepID=A0A6P6NT45_CARAU|nr:uncharacterized protein LOC113089295 [Carassius auratus]